MMGDPAFLSHCASFAFGVPPEKKDVLVLFSYLAMAVLGFQICFHLTIFFVN